MNLSSVKKIIQDNVNGYYYAILSNVLRSTVFPYRANKKIFSN